MTSYWESMSVSLGRQARLEWRCELHQIKTTTDCPKCDDEQIADLEGYANLPVCHACKRTLCEGESAWADDVKVMGPEGVRVEVRYTCDACEATA